jgi:hypothetical protein
VKQPSPNQHYRLSIQKAVQDYKDGIITATGLVYYTVGIYRAPGQKLRVKDIDAFCKELEINRATFYRAISKLKAKNRLEWEAIAGVDLWIPLEPNVVQHPTAQTQSQQEVSQSCETLSQSCETLSQSCETLSQSCETLSPDGESLSQLGNNQSLEGLQEEASGDSSNIYQVFINSLSEGEGESFEKFVREEWKRLKGEEIISLERFLAREEDIKNWHQRFLNSPAGWEAKKKAIAAQFDWHKDPRFDDWIRKAFNGGILWTQEDEAEREQRYAFFCWAQGIDAYRGICY